MKKDEIQTFSYRISQANKTQLIVIMYDMAIQYVSDAIEIIMKRRQKKMNMSLM